MKVLKRVLKFMRVFIIIVVIAGVIIIITQYIGKDKNVESSKENTEGNTTTLNEEDNNTVQNDIEDVMKDIDNMVKNTEESSSKQKQDVKVENKGQETKTSNNKDITVQQENPSINNSDTTNKEKEDTNPASKDKVSVPGNENVPGTETKKEENTKEIIEYKKSTVYTNKLKEYINSHQSELMKERGYTIQEDKSIKELTNYFTYSAFNINSYLPSSFGTIRIYVENKYVNGVESTNPVDVRCYIL